MTARGVLDTDLLVVGAGPAGTAAAIEARRNGLDVVVVDQAHFPRDKTCGDGLTTAALRTLERLGVGVPALTSYVRIDATVVESPSGRQLVLPMPRDGHHVAVVRRAELDAALVERARSAGATVRAGAGVDALQQHNGSVEVVLADGTGARAPFVVAADGHYSRVRRIVEPAHTPDLGTWHAVRQYFRGVDDDRLWILFDRALLPGYAWVFPLGGGCANVGFGVLRGTRDGKTLRDLWTRVLAGTRLRSVLGNRAEPDGVARAWPIPCDYSPARLANGRVLFAGDAAAVVDRMTGEGIAQALETGMLAARSVASSRHDAVAVACTYRRAVERAVGRDLRFAARLQRVLASPLGARAAVRIPGATAWTRRSFARWMFEDYPRATVLTPDRWRPGLFGGPGAYRSIGPPVP